MRKPFFAVVSFVCAFALLLSFFPIPAGAAGDLVSIKSYKVTSMSNGAFIDGVSGFTQGNVTIELTLDYDSSTHISKVQIGGDSFSLQGGKLFISDTDPISNGAYISQDNKTVTLPLYYSGGGSGLTLNITYESTASAPTVTDTYTQTISIKEAISSSNLPTAGKPSFVIANGEMPVLKAGVSSPIKLTLTNNSDFAAYGVTATLGESDIIQPSGVSDVLGLGDFVSGKSSQISLSVLVNEKTPSGYYYINLNLSMRNIDGAQADQPLRVAVQVKNPALDNPSKGALLSLSAVRASSSGADGITLSLDIQNTGDKSSDAGSATLSGFDAAALTLAESLSKKALPPIVAGGSVTVTFSIRAASSLVSGNYPLSLNLAWTTAGKDAKTDEEVLYVPVSRAAPPSTGALQITSVTQNKTEPSGDNRIDITVTLTNTGKTSFDGVTLKLGGLATGAITLRGGFPQKTVGTVAAGKSVSVVYPLQVDPKLAAGSYSLSALVDYAGASDSDKISTDFFVDVTRPDGYGGGTATTKPVPQIIISNYSVDTDSISAGESFTLSFTLHNTSKTSAVENMKVTLTQADGVFLPKSGSNSFYVEKLAEGGSASFTIELSPKRDAETKSYPLSIGMNFQDADGKQYDVTESLSLPVNQPQRLEVSNVTYYPMGGFSPSPLNFQYINKGRSTLYNLTIHVEGPFTSANGPLFVGNFAASSSDYFDDQLTPTEAGNLTGTIVFEYEDAAGNPKKYEQTFTAFIEDSQPVDPGNPTDGGGDIPIDGGADIPAEGPNNLPIILGAGAAVLLVGGIVLFRILRKRKDKKLFDEDASDSGKE